MFAGSGPVRSRCTGYESPSPGQRLNSRRWLADTTAESGTSVKHADHLDGFNFASAGGRGRRPQFAEFLGRDDRRCAEKRVCDFLLDAPQRLIRRSFFSKDKMRSTRGGSTKQNEPFVK